MITLGHVLAFIAVGLVVGGLARVLSHDRERAAWLFDFWLAIAGALIGGFASRGLGLSTRSEPAGFVLSFAGAMLFVGSYLLARRRLSLP